MKSYDDILRIEREYCKEYLKGKLGKVYRQFIKDIKKQEHEYQRSV